MLDLAPGPPGPLKAPAQAQQIRPGPAEGTHVSFHLGFESTEQANGWNQNISQLRRFYPGDGVAFMSERRKAKKSTSQLPPLDIITPAVIPSQAISLQP